MGKWHPKPPINRIMSGRRYVCNEGKIVRFFSGGTLNVQSDRYFTRELLLEVEASAEAHAAIRSASMSEKGTTWQPKQWEAHFEEGR